MKILKYGKDGGPESTVWGYWLIEWKPVFSVALLCFENGSREAYHSHAFDSVSWLLKGQLVEHNLDVLGNDWSQQNVYIPTCIYRRSSQSLPDVKPSTRWLVRGGRGC